MSAKEVNRGLTQAFIDSDPTDLVLVPTVQQKSATGGTIAVDGPARESQTFKLIPMSYTQAPTVTVNGVERRIDYTLLGTWDCEMEVGDHWTGDDGNRYEVVFMVPGHGYETKGWVYCHV